MDKDALRSFLLKALMSMVAPSMGHEERRDMLDCMFPVGQSLDDETLDAFAQGIAPPPREFFAKWIGIFVDKVLDEMPAERLHAACENDQMAQAGLYVAYLDFCRERQADMDRDLEALRLECMTRMKQ
ncbi:hypothetical protein [Desulfocurvibacter africanus]|uniref:hypothetical protein n=1 Tax=Desulfocurvibacter africanus TaxID=873 RepID=UPI0004285D1A|nr:hypothetical protein [Desulfocurvibacter africanus]